MYDCESIAKVVSSQISGAEFLRYRKTTKNKRTKESYSTFPLLLRSRCLKSSLDNYDYHIN